MNKAYLLTGGNVGNITYNLLRAEELAARFCGKIVNTSAVYKTAAWGKEDQPAFLNQVLEINTILSAPRLLNNILAIEKKMGRVREEKYGPRIIDIDLLLFNNEIIRSPQLTVPHPEMQNRRFCIGSISRNSSQYHSSCIA